jgi:hypothetical protein
VADVAFCIFYARSGDTSMCMKHDIFLNAVLYMLAMYIYQEHYLFSNVKFTYIFMTCMYVR